MIKKKRKYRTRNARIREMAEEMKRLPTLKAEKGKKDANSS